MLHCIERLVSIVLCRIIDEVRRICKTYHERIASLEDQKFDLEYVVKRKDMEVVRRVAMKQLTFHELTTLTILHHHNIILTICDVSKCRVVYSIWFNRLNVNVIFLTRLLLPCEVSNFANTYYLLFF